MQPAELLKYIENPQLLGKQQVKELQKLVEDFPYFQPAHILLSLASKKWDASVYQQSLKKTAIVVTNRSHLFNLIQKLEQDALQLSTQVETSQIISNAEEKRSKQDGGHELDILKATEISSEEIFIVVDKTSNIDQNADKPEINKEAEKIENQLKKTKTVLAPEEILEQEIGNQVVNAFVEKEILKTPELHHPKQKEEPENFVEWLSLLKKNNGQTYKQIEEQLTAEKLRTKPTLNPNSVGSTTAEENTITTESSTQNSRKEKNRALIDKIIESSPGAIRNKDKEEQKFFTADNKAKESLLENEHLVTETLAKIYALQGSVNKAVRAYEILSLKFPQKSAYFASLIQKLKSNQ